MDFITYIRRFIIILIIVVIALPLLFFTNKRFMSLPCCRALEDWDSSPPCMADIYRCMGKAARAALCAIARHLRLRSE